MRYIALVRQKKSRAEYPISVRATEEDLKMLEWLHTRTGLTNSALVKLALRRLYEKEGGQLPKLQNYSSFTSGV
jgi:hypothetical protein